MEHLVKDLQGDESVSTNEAAKEIQKRLDIAIESGPDIVVDLRKNNGRKPVFEEFWDVVASYIDDVSALDDRHHATIDDRWRGRCEHRNGLLICRYVQKTHKDRAREMYFNIPLYAWFILQFWPSSISVSNMLHYTGRFRVRRMIQGRLLHHDNPGSQ